MKSASDVNVISTLPRRPRSVLWPARLDVLQSVTGLALALFMWGHMFLVSSILLGKDAMWMVSKFFEGYFVFGRSYPALVSGVVAAIFVLFVAHAALALRKFPASYRQFRTVRQHARAMRHEDTTLWWWQVITGFALFFLASVHLYIMLTRPDRIGPYASSDRIWTEHLWPLYLLLLFAVEFHAGVGLYRLAMKWGWPASADAARMRRGLKRLKWILTVFFISIGLATLAAYMRIGFEHRDHYGERYVPSHLAPAQRGVPQ
jgi:fumarate reductase subunit C